MHVRRDCAGQTHQVVAEVRRDLELKADSAGLRASEKVLRQQIGQLQVGLAGVIGSRVQPHGMMLLLTGGGDTRARYCASKCWSECAAGRAAGGQVWLSPPLTVLVLVATPSALAAGSQGAAPSSPLGSHWGCCEAAADAATVQVPCSPDCPGVGGLQEDIEHVRAVAVQVKQQGASVTEQMAATQKQTAQLQVRPYLLCSRPRMWLACAKSMPGTASGLQCSTPWHVQGTEF